MASLNIKDPAVYTMASVMANRWSTTRTGAVRRALEESIRADGPDARAQLVEAALKEVRQHVRPDWTAKAEDHELYDEHGLPR